MLPPEDKTPWGLLALVGGSGVFFLWSLWMWAMGV